MNTNAGTQVDCRLTINGVVIEFKMDGPLVALAPAGEKAEKRPVRERAKRAMGAK